MNKTIENKKNKTSEKLYNLNVLISLRCFVIKEKLSIDELSCLNGKIGEIIKEIRLLEDKINNDKKL